MKDYKTSTSHLSMKSNKTNKWEKKLFSTLYKLRQTKLGYSTNQSETTISDIETWSETSNFDHCGLKSSYKESKQSISKYENTKKDVKSKKPARLQNETSTESDRSSYNDFNKESLKVSKRHVENKKEETNPLKQNTHSAGIESLQARLSNEENRLIEVDQKLSFTFNRLADNEKIVSALKDEINQLKVSLQVEKDNHELTNKRLDNMLNIVATNSVASQKSFATNCYKGKEVFKPKNTSTLQHEPNYYSEATINEIVKRNATNAVESRDESKFKDTFSNKLFNSLVEIEDSFLQSKSEQLFTSNMLNSKLDTAYEGIQKLQRRLANRNNYSSFQSKTLNDNCSMVPSCNVPDGKVVEANSSLESLYLPCQTEIKEKYVNFNFDEKTKKGSMKQNSFLFDTKHLNVSILKVCSSKTSCISSGSTETAYFSS